MTIVPQVWNMVQKVSGDVATDAAAIGAAHGEVESGTRVVSAPPRGREEGVGGVRTGPPPDTVPPSQLRNEDRTASCKAVDRRAHERRAGDLLKQAPAPRNNGLFRDWNGMRDKAERDKTSIK